MRLADTALALGMAAGLVLAASSAMACNCPKEAMLKLHGTVSMVPADLQESGRQRVVPAPAIDPLAIDPQPIDPQPIDPQAIHPLSPSPADALVQPGVLPSVPATIPQQ